MAPNRLYQPLSFLPLCSWCCLQGVMMPRSRLPPAPWMGGGGIGSPEESVDLLGSSSDLDLDLDLDLGVPAAAGSSSDEEGRRGRDGAAGRMGRGSAGVRAAGPAVDAEAGGLRGPDGVATASPVKRTRRRAAGVEAGGASLAGAGSGSESGSDVDDGGGEGRRVAATRASRSNWLKAGLEAQAEEAAVVGVGVGTASVPRKRRTAAKKSSEAADGAAEATRGY